jgi:hypothetical protein
MIRRWPARDRASFISPERSVVHASPTLSPRRWDTRSELYQRGESSLRPVEDPEKCARDENGNGNPGTGTAPNSGTSAATAADQFSYVDPIN